MYNLCRGCLYASVFDFTYLHSLKKEFLENQSTKEQLIVIILFIGMDSFYGDLHINLKSFYQEMTVKKEKLFQHNHQPVRFIVEDCMYCRIFGNVLVESLNSNVPDIRTTQDTITYSVHHKIFD
jgi:hypothetical protein